MAVKAPPTAPAAVYSWTGWYAGVNAGASFGSAKTDFNNGPVVITSGAISATSSPFTITDTTYPSGFIGGGQLGYNWHYSPLMVLGLEADFQGALERDHNRATTAFSAPGIFSNGPATTFTGTALTDYTTKIDWFGTVRARIGYVWGNGNVLSYLTGGLAYGRVDVTGTNNLSGAETLGAVFSVTNAFSHNAVNTGWVLGYGTEGVIDFWGARNWTWKVESFYMDLGHLSTTGVITSSSAAGACAPCTSTGGLTTRTHFTDGILRGGLNFKFN